VDGVDVAPTAPHSLFSLSLSLSLSLLSTIILSSVQERKKSFVHILDRFACYLRDYHRGFVLLLFWFLLLLESNIHIWIALLSWFYLVLVSVPQEPQEGEKRGVRILRVFEQNMSDMRIFFYH
jgi:hypothetical protein